MKDVGSIQKVGRHVYSRVLSQAKKEIIKLQQGTLPSPLQMVGRERSPLCPGFLFIYEKE